MSQLFISGGQSFGASALASVLPMNIQDRFSLGLTFFRIDLFDLLAVQGTLKSLLQHHSSKASIVGIQLSLWSNSHNHSAHQWRNGDTDIHMEYYSTAKKKEIQPLAITSMKL